MSETRTYALPPSIVTKADVSRFLSEIERVDGALTTSTVRSKVSGEKAEPLVIAANVTDFLALNQLSLDDSRARTALIHDLRYLKDHVPVLHMTFATEADGESLETIITWVRREIDPNAVIEVGLQPDLIAGVYVRTPNHIHDLSARSLLKGGHELLVKELQGLK
ncbi:MAG TPA: hypothetical protein VFQ70_03220 [Candidatus Saccharimonadaceae bacterium]|nr:hypothetical protein [Candidatus Saccharimonadaceae bacterium]